MLDHGQLIKDDMILTWLRDRFLRDLVDRPVHSNTGLKETMSRLNLNPYFNFPAIALLDAGGVPEREHEKAAYMERMRDYLLSRVSDGSVVFMDKEGRVGLLFSWVSKHVLESVCRMLDEQFGLPVNIGVGMPCQHLSEVHGSYRQAAAALENRFYRGNGTIIYYSELEGYRPLKEYPSAKEKEFYEAVKASDSDEEIVEAVDEFYKSVLLRGPIDVRSIYELTVRLLVGLEKRALAETDQTDGYKPVEIMTIIKLDSFEALKRYVAGFAAGLREVMSMNGKESHRSIIKKTLHYMEQDCQNVTLFSAAKKVYMTPTYLSLLFKMNMGKTFIDQLTDIRIEKAKDMLKRTHMKNYEVSELVGSRIPVISAKFSRKKQGFPQASTGIPKWIKRMFKPGRRGCVKSE
nr:hypothetical protein [Cohnella luojiensis]